MDQNAGGTPVLQGIAERFDFGEVIEVDAVGLRIVGGNVGHVGDDKMIGQFLQGKVNGNGVGLALPASAPSVLLLAGLGNGGVVVAQFAVHEAILGQFFLWVVGIADLVGDEDGQFLAAEFQFLKFAGETVGFAGLAGDLNGLGADGILLACAEDELGGRRQLGVEFLQFRPGLFNIIESVHFLALAVQDSVIAVMGFEGVRF